MSLGYRVAPIFLVRMAGVPFDVLEKLATPRTSDAARKLLLSESRLFQAKSEAESLLNRRNNGLSPEEFHDLRSAVRGNRAPKLDGKQTEFAAYAQAAGELSDQVGRVSKLLESELENARSSLLAVARETLVRYLVFGGTGTADLFIESTGDEVRALPPRNKRARERERHLLLYLQRIAAKNDTFSEFGPSGWGRIETAIHGLKIDVQPGIAARETFLERWTAHASAAAMNADPEVFTELSPRLNPNATIQKSRLIFTDTDELIDLDSAQLELLRRCDGATPVHALNESIEQIRAFVAQRVLFCAVEVPALNPHAFDVLCADVTKWRAGLLRDKWLSLLQPLAELPKQFGKTQAVPERREIFQRARHGLESIGATRPASARFLYSAKNTIGEECFRQCGVSVGEDLINEVVVDAVPWIDLWRDSYAFVASRVADGLRQIFAKAPTKNGAMSLPAFLRACEIARAPLTGPGLVAFSHLAFQEVKTAFREMMAGKTDKAEHELTADECHLVRRKFRYPAFDEYTYPSADLQLSAASVEAVAKGDYQWILAELHPTAALLHHGGYWSCPDKDLLNASFLEAIDRKPTFHFGIFAADFTSHTTVRFDALSDFFVFVSEQRGNPAWRQVRPADAEVYVDPVSNDVCLRTAGDHVYLGSFTRNWIIALGFHPFQFGHAPHMPRLRCGKVVVQRRAWTVTLEELGAGDYHGISRDLVLATERLRAQRDLPRHVYIRPTEQALRRSGAEGRDKDTKPVYIDFESYLFLEIFHRWLVKAGELEVTEMLPAPDQLPWREADGRHTFEFRTMILPRS